MTHLSGITFSTLFGLSILGVLLFIGFTGYRRLILPVVVLKEKGLRHQKSVDRIETISWIFFAILVIYFSLMESLLVTTILITLVAIAFFDFWKNFFSGIILKFGDKVKLNDSITTAGTSGKVTSFGSRALRLTNHVGEEILLPYVLIDKEIKIEQKSQPGILLKTYVSEAQVGVTKEKIKSVILRNPWIVISSPIDVVIKDGQAILSFYVLNNEFFEKAKKRLMRDLG